MWAELGFAVCAALVLYILVLYPLLLRFSKDPQRPAIRKDMEHRTTVTVILAVYNGAAFLRQKLDTLIDLDYPRELVNILVASDGSTDATAAIAGEYADRGVTLIQCPRGGKSAAVNAALQHATGELLFFTDVRQPIEKDALTHLVANFADPTVGAVTGKLELLPGDNGEQQDMGLYWRYELWARGRHSEIDSLFNTTGCIYALRRSLASVIPVDTLSDDAVLPLRAFRQGYRVIYDPAAVAFDYPAVAGTEFRRRWRNLAGLWQVHVRMRWLFTSSNRMRRHFLPHKFGRLMLPWAVLGAIVFTLAMQDSWVRTLLLAGELGSMALAVLDGWVPLTSKLKRLTSPARAFVVMNGAALVAVCVFFVPAQTLWQPTKVRTN